MPRIPELIDFTPEQAETFVYLETLLALRRFSLPATNAPAVNTVPSSLSMEQVS